MFNVHLAIENSIHLYGLQCSHNLACIKNTDDLNSDQKKTKYTARQMWCLKSKEWKTIS